MQIRPARKMQSLLLADGNLPADTSKVHGIPLKPSVMHTLQKSIGVRGFHRA